MLGGEAVIPLEFHDSKRKGVLGRQRRREQQRQQDCPAGEPSWDENRFHAGPLTLRPAVTAQRYL